VGEIKRLLEKSGSFSGLFVTNSMAHRAAEAGNTAGYVYTGKYPTLKKQEKNDRQPKKTM